MVASISVWRGWDEWDEVYALLFALDDRSARLQGARSFRKGQLATL